MSPVSGCGSLHPATGRLRHLLGGSPLRDLAFFGRPAKCDGAHTSPPDFPSTVTGSTIRRESWRFNNIYTNVPPDFPSTVTGSTIRRGIMALQQHIYECIS